MTLAILLPLFLAACRFWQQPETTGAPNKNIAVVAPLISELPFSAGEPENYQAEIVSRIYSGDQEITRKSFTARNGLRRLTVFNVGEKTEISSLNLGGDSSFSIYPARKIYSENTLQANSPANSADNFPTNEWLNAENRAAFENLGTENNLTKYRVRLNDSANSEILIYIDENLKIPVREEFYTVSGAQRTLTFSTEIKDFKPQADEKFFEVPKGYRLVSPQEFQEVLWREKFAAND